MVRALVIISATVSAAATLIVLALSAWLVRLGFRASGTAVSHRRPKDP